MSDRILWGYKQIAARLGCSPRSVLTASKLPRDPLRLCRIGGKVWMLESDVVSWGKRRDGADTDGEKKGWVEIAAAVRASVRTAQRWAARKVDPLPVEHRGRTAYAAISAIRDWLDGQGRVMP